MQEVEELVLIDGREDRLAPLSRMFPNAGCFRELSGALAELDAVVIATPPTTHVPLALEAIEAGKHVLVEKPLATNVSGARRLIEAAREAGVLLMVGHTFEYNPVVWKLRDLIENHKLGDLYYLDSARLNLGLYQSDVNVIWDLAPHDVSIINHLLGRRPTWVQAWASRHAHRRLADVAYLRLRYDETELQANIHVSWLDPCKVRRLTAVGSHKMAVYNDLATEERIRIYDKGVSGSPPDNDMAEAPMSYRYGDIVAPYVAMDEPLRVQDHHFVGCIRTGACPATDGENGLAVVEILEAAQLSAQHGRRVHLDEVRHEAPVDHQKILAVPLSPIAVERQPAADGTPRPRSRAPAGVSGPVSQAAPAAPGLGPTH
jgi:predicted dehydrogenase